MFEKNIEENRLEALHHPFCAPNNNDLGNKSEWEANLPKARAQAYDLVLNGLELGGGSLRIHQPELQIKVLETIGLPINEAKEQFGFLMNAFEYGAPPHGGIAFGFDRLCAILGGEENIRDFIAFPKNTSGRDVMIDSPSIIDNDQLDELGIKLSD